MNIILKKILRNNNGQAIVEVAICLIPLMLIICFIIFFAVINRESLEAMLLAQKNLTNGIGNITPVSINHISKGKDNLSFTADDIYTFGNNGNVEFFNNELITSANPKNNDYSIGTESGSFNLHNNPYILTKAMQPLPTNNLYLSAADLIGYEETVGDIIEENNLDTVLEVLNKLIKLENNFEIKEKLFNTRRDIDSN